MSEKQTKVVFDNILTLAKLVNSKARREMTPLRLQKTYILFLLFMERRLDN